MYKFHLPLGFRWVLSLFLQFSLRFTSTSGLFQFCTLNGWGISPSSLSTKCATCEYNPSTVAPVAINGIVGVGGSHFCIMCLRDFALSFTSAQSLHIIKCLYHRRHSFYEFFLFGLFLLIYHIT